MVEAIDFALEVGEAISGRITSAATGLPIPDVEVSAEGLEGQEGSYTTTDSDGRYELRGLAPGSYRVMVVAERLGYFTALEDELVTVLEGVPVTGFDIGLKSGATISGIVTDAETGLPIPNVEIGAQSIAGDGANFFARTGSDGRYTLRGLIPGTYRIGIDPSDRGYTPELYDDKRRWEDADLVTVSSAGTVEGIDFGLRLGAMISGRVIDTQTGLPIANVEVLAGIDSDRIARTYTDSNGSFTLRGLPEGVVEVVAEGRRGYLGQRTTVSISGTLPVEGIDFGLELGATISGGVTDVETGLPIANVGIGAEPTEDISGAWTNTDFDGRYTLEGLAPGIYRVRTDGSELGYIQELYNAKLLSKNADLVFVSGTEAIEGIDFKLRVGATISGRVTDAQTGAPVGDVHVEAESRDGGPGSSTYTDFDGRYILKGLTPARYVVFVNAEGRGYVQQHYNDELYRQDADVIILSDDGVTDIDLALRPGATISGKVTDAVTGLGIPNMDVHAGPAGTGEHFAWGSTDANGEYTQWGLPEGPTEVEVSGQGYLEQRRNLVVNAGEHFTGFDF